MTRGYAVFDGNVQMGLNHAGFVIHANHDREDGMFFWRKRDAAKWRAQLERVGAKVYNPPLDVRETEVSE